MSRVWFSTELETVASWWRIYRKDGVTFGLTSHDRDLVFDDIIHRTAPGMLPSAIRLSADFSPDSSEVTGAIDHEAIRDQDLDAGRFDGARIEQGLVDWVTGESRLLYAGSIGNIGRDGGQFTAELRSLKHGFDKDDLPRSSPTCRAVFGGPGCNLSPARFTHDGTIAVVSFGDNAIRLAETIQPERLLDGFVRWIDGLAVGMTYQIVAIDGARLILDRRLSKDATSGQRVTVREGCDHTIATCSGKFGNAINFRGEPFLPGNDMLARYPTG